MHFFRSLGRGFLIVLITATLAVWITLATMYVTVLQRTVVLGWAEKSGLYDNLVSSVVQLMPTEGEDRQFLGESTIRAAIENTLSPSFIRQSTEKVVHASYDWLEGKAATIIFTIPLNDKRPELQKQLALAIEPQIAALPRCTSQFNATANVSCLPPGTTANAFAEDLARRAVESTDFLKDPLTQNSFQPGQLPSLEWLRFITQNALYFVIGLPIFAILCVGLYTLLYQPKILGLRIAGRRVFFSTLLTVIVAGLIWGLHRSVSLSAFGDQVIIARIIDPLFHQIAGGIGMWLFIFSSSVLLVSGALWFIASLIEKRMANVTSKPPESPQELPPAQPVLK